MELHSNQEPSKGATDMKLLIVDDEARHVRGMTQMIRTLRPAYEVASAKNGAEALRCVEETSPQLVLSDIRMPEMDGLTFLQKLVSVPDRPKVVFLSAYDVFEYAQTAIRNGAYDYLLKPVEPEKVEAVLQRFEAETSAAPDVAGGAQPLPPSKRGRSEIAVDACIRLIQERYMDDLTLEAMAERFYFNASYFSTMFKQQTGRTFSELLTETRMQRAKELLADPNGAWKVYEVAERCGYRDTKYFCRIFKKTVGAPPEAYRHSLVAAGKERGAQ